MNNNELKHSTARQALRKAALAKRAALSSAAHAAFSAQIVAYLLKTFVPPKNFAFCCPIKNEVNILPLVATWQAAGSKALLPVVQAPQAPLLFRHWQADEPLENDAYGIPTPIAGAFEIPTCLLIPLNAFDSAGYRLGYGGGFFDRTLAAYKTETIPRPLCIGIGFECCRFDSIHPATHDIALDWLVTEAGVFKVSP